MNRQYRDIIENGQFVRFLFTLKDLCVIIENAT